MKENPPDIDIARELDIFSKAHFPTNDNSNHHQQQSHTIHSALSKNYSQQHYQLDPQFTFTASASPSSSSSTSFFHPTTANATLRPAPANSIAASNNLISAHTPKNPEKTSMYESYAVSYQNAMTDSTHSHSGSPHSGYTTPTPYTAAHHNTISDEQQKQQTFDQFMSMMNMVDQRLQQLGNHDNSVPLFQTGAPPTSHTSPASTSSGINTLSNASLVPHPDHQVMTTLPTKTTTTPIASSSTPTRGGRGRRKKIVSMATDRKGKRPVTNTPTVSTSYPTSTSTFVQHHEQDSGSNTDNLSDLEDEDDDDDDDDDNEDDHQPAAATSSSSQRDQYARDKRRRNTEASARFRIKKKMREQALRRTADEMTLRSQHLQQRVHELEKEIKWLRELIVEKKQSHST